MHNILIVDDSRSIRSLLQFALADFDNLRIITAVDGKDALQRIDSNSFDLIITDVNMPNMNGLDFTLVCRKSKKITCPILILTTESEKDMRERGREVGANGWIVKPFKPEGLVKTVRKFIDI